MTVPILLSSCAIATSAAEAKFRIDRPNSRPRASKIIALDTAACEVMRHVEDESWSGARFFAFVGKLTPPGIEQLALDATLLEEGSGLDKGGPETNLSTAIEEADVVVMIASDGSSAEAAQIIGNAAHVRGIMTAGLIVTAQSNDHDVDRAIQALRPYASVLVVAASEDYVPAMLHALRA